MLKKKKKIAISIFLWGMIEERPYSASLRLKFDTNKGALDAGSLEHLSGADKEFLKCQELSYND